jgi:hypothetical protein
MKVKQFLYSPWSTPIMLLFVTIVTYGLLIPWLGFYWDDWPMVWFLHTLGPLEFKSVFAIDRPILAWTYMITTPILGVRPINWQVFGLICHWLSAVSVFWTLRTIWPRRPQEAKWIAFLFLVYPGFSQHSISLIYSHYFLILAAFTFSLGLTVLSIRNPRWTGRLMVLSLLTSAYSMFSIEYFAGLELIRPLLIWWTLNQGSNKALNRKMLKRFLKFWAPYLTLYTVFILYRVLVVRFSLYQPRLIEELFQTPWATLSSLIQTIFLDILEASFGAWITAFTLPSSIAFGRLSTVIYFCLVITTFVAIFAYLLATGRKAASRNAAPTPPDADWHKQILVCALVSLIVGGLPVWIPKLNLSLDFTQDRFTLPMMFGTSLLIVGLLSFLRNKSILKVVIIGILVSVASGKQFLTQNEFRLAWEQQKRFLHQLSLRVPGLESGTTIVINKEPIIYVSDNSLTAPINWMYAPNNKTTEMPYMFYDLTVRFSSSLNELEPNSSIYHKYRATTFTGSTSQILAIHYAPPRCLRVVDPVLDDSLPMMGGTYSQAVALSRLDLIKLDVDTHASLPEEIFGPILELTSWCDYFELADLARQKRDWSEIVELGDVAFSLDDKPNEASERIPFIEGYANAGHWERARNLTTETFLHNEITAKALCNAWSRIELSAEVNEIGEATIRQVKDELTCSD